MWERFLSSKRIGSSRPAAPGGETLRSEFHKDYDRIIFSSAFRRLSDKTQVVPFPQSDYTRQRLTHSLEVSCVGRSLATSVYAMVREQVEPWASQGDFEAIVAAACLAHDIGNPPFGHFGERAIQDWATGLLVDSSFDALTSRQKQDLTRFEGNAQSFRVVTRLQMSNRPGGMRLTAATLGALIKYPCCSDATGDRYKKHGCFDDDARLFGDVFSTAGRAADDHGQYARHPLALLSEAADDICYAIIDLEDGCRAGLISVADGLGLLEEICAGATGSAEMPDAERLSMGRAMVIGGLVSQCVDVFRQHTGSILDGTFRGALIDQVPAAAAYRATKKISFERVFNSERVLELEAAGYKAIQGLLQILTAAALTDSPNSFDGHVRKLTQLSLSEDATIYQRLLACTDIVSGMTDRHCIDLFRRLTGLPVAADGRDSGTSKR
ncbi:MAG: dNTP triphosphohydrolase [Planctomycetaceae bacterium]|nr:dNTP triphosphohydrolase [Planctomycetaceae bacterium]